jgi:hypothetical protein
MWARDSVTSMIIYTEKIDEKCEWNYVAIHACQHIKFCLIKNVDDIVTNLRCLKGGK